MYDEETIRNVINTVAFENDRAYVQDSLSKLRYRQAAIFEKAATTRIKNFVECVLSSAPLWPKGTGIDLCRLAGELAELLSQIDIEIKDSASLMRLKAALLYEMGDAPSVSATLIENDDYNDTIVDFFKRRGIFAHLNGNAGIMTEGDSTVESILSFKGFASFILDPLSCIVISAWPR